jgi:phosphoserine phosphatase RsbU/P
MKTVAIIEDDNTLRTVLAGEMADRGYKIVSAKNGEEGLKVIRESKPEVVILDIVMPQKGGIDVLRELKEDAETKDIPVLMLTVSVAAEKAKETVALGAVDYVIKSEHSVADIANKIVNILEKKGV